MGRRSRPGLAKDGVMIGSVQRGLARSFACTVLLAVSGATAQVGPAVPGTEAAPGVDRVDASQPVAEQPSAIDASKTTPPDAWQLPQSESLPLGVVEAPSELLASDTASEEGTREFLPAGTPRTLLALGGVLLLIGALAWVFKKVARTSGGLAGAVGAGGRAPAGLVEVLARYPLGVRQTLVVIRFDRRVLLCSMSGGGRAGSGAMTTLCELDSPEDVASVLVKTRDEAGDSIARTFERAMDEADQHAERRETTEPIRVRVPAGYAMTQRGEAPQSQGSLSRGLGSLLRGRAQ